MKLKTSTKILIVAVIIGLCLLLYPSFANFYNENMATRTVTEYVHTLQGMSEDEYKKYWEEAKDYNDRLSASADRNAFYMDHRDEYMKCLNPDDSGVFGLIEIPKIDLSLPLYHTTTNEILGMAIGHLEWTSLPTGGPGTHCCVSGHRGLASAKLFTNLDLLRDGDQFTLSIMDQVLTYEVDQIHTVLPSESGDLQIVPGQDYCTLITCTPYGINTHRLLVRGRRVETTVPQVRVISEAILIDERIVALFLSIPILFLLVMAVMLKKPEKKVKPGQAAAIMAQTKKKNAGREKKMAEMREMIKEKVRENLGEKKK